MPLLNYVTDKPIETTVLTEEMFNDFMIKFFEYGKRIERPFVYCTEREYSLFSKAKIFNFTQEEIENAKKHSLGFIGKQRGINCYLVIS